MIVEFRKGVASFCVLFLFAVCSQAAADVSDEEVDGQRRLRFGQTFFLSGSPTNIPIYLDSVGDERLVRFSVRWNTDNMRFVRFDRGAGLPSDASVALDTSQVVSGRVGLTISSQNGFQPGSRLLGNIVGFGSVGQSSTFQLDFVNAPNQIDIRGENGSQLESVSTGTAYPFAVADQKLNLTIAEASATPGQSLSMPVSLRRAFIGFEGSTTQSFSLVWDPAVFEYLAAQAGSAIPAGAAVTINESQIAQGKLGVLVSGRSPFDDSVVYKPVQLSLKVKPAITTGSYAISFGDQPTPLTAGWTPGFVNVGRIYSTVSGSVLSPNGQAVRNTQVVLSDSLGFTQTVMTNQFGLFQLANVPTGVSYTLTVRSKNYRFVPQVVNVSDNISNLEFRGLE